MPILKGDLIEKEAIIYATRLMLASARTAPKAGGEDDIFTAVVLGETKDAIAAKIEE